MKKQCVVARRHIINGTGETRLRQRVNNNSKMIKKVFMAIVLVLVLFNSCKKDQIDVVNISGNVKNNCTDSGWANVTVHLFTNYSHSSIFNKKSSSDEISTATNANGDFVFSNFSINHNSDYTYIVTIDNLDHYIGGNPLSDFGHSGISGEINKDNPSNFLHLGIQGTFYLINFLLPNGTYITPPDSIKIKLSQPVFHRNMPQNLWEVDLGAGSNINYTQINDFGGYPMGMWHIYLTKIKNGMTSNIHDSIYLNMGGTGNYHIPW
ncbi:MAG: hypothetical protein WCP52_03220 [Bacteroidota bacterium]